MQRTRLRNSQTVSFQQKRDLPDRQMPICLRRIPHPYVETVGTSNFVTNINAAENQGCVPVDSKRIKATWAGIKNMKTNQKDNNSRPLAFDMGRISFGRNKEKKQEERDANARKGF